MDAYSDNTFDIFKVYSTMHGGTKHYYEQFEDIKRGNQKPYIEEGQIIRWPKEKRQNDIQWSTKQYTENSSHERHKNQEITHVFRKGK